MEDDRRLLVQMEDQRREVDLLRLQDGQRRDEAARRVENDRRYAQELLEAEEGKQRSEEWCNRKDGPLTREELETRRQYAQVEDKQNDESTCCQRGRTVRRRGKNSGASDTLRCQLVSMPSSHLPILYLLVAWVHCLPGNNHSANSTLHHDYCVLGAGPAGLQMGYFLSKSQRDYIILERNSGPGSFFNIYPRHRKLISINKIYTGRRNREFNLRHDWNSLLSDRPDLLLQRISTQMYPEADALPRYLSLYARELGLKVQYGVDIGRVSASNLRAPGGRSYTLIDQKGTEYSCRVLLVSTGLWVPQQVHFVGSDLVEGYETAPVDPEQYRNQAVLILGKGNSAFETAQNILGRASSVHLYSRNPVRLAWQTHYVGDLRMFSPPVQMAVLRDRRVKMSGSWPDMAVNNEVLDTYQLKSLDGLAEGSLEEIAIVKGGGADGKRRGRTGKGRGTGKEGRGQLYLTLAELLDTPTGNKTSDVTTASISSHHNDNFPLRQPYDRVIRCLGFRFNFSIFDSSARPSPSAEARGRLPRVTAWYEGQGTPGLFVLGTAAHSRDYRSSAGGFIHGFRYTVRAVHRVLEQRYHGIAWPSILLSTNQLSSWLLRRVNEASGPYQMFGVLGDIVLLRDSHCEYLEEFPLQALPKLTTLTGHQVTEQGLLVLVMEYGLNHTDTLGLGRSQTEWTQGWRSRFLHPVLYFYSMLPSERDMRHRPAGWPLPRPKAIHHIIEDFLTKWDAPISHIQPLRRFLEHCLQTDLRAFYAESCFRFSLTNRRLPPFCYQGYLRKQGLIGNSQLWQHAREAGLMPASHNSWTAPENTPLPNRMNHPRASMASGINLDP
ncbi:hypothetical protein SKAU_G00293100 [Synaphobranchus kaupii]|uniref:FAD-dependent oxidoreductase domain-containing protein 2 n=1 Tax=Synaphobranchus kaupii TaxID=118154 RepID=A0A9Q1ILK0_SYNKA|nr:hypothetical protein SKAU_G00293100 [Synaphobranchus kaupii]